MAPDFVEIDHSGDIGIEAIGADMSEVLVNLTRGLFSLLYRGDIQPVAERAILIESRSTEDLAVDWLNEVIALGGTRGEAYGAVSVEVKGLTAKGSVVGEPIDVARHRPRLDVKAATYHDVCVECIGETLRARVIFDL